MAEVERISNGKHNLRNLALVNAAMQVLLGVELSPLAVFHHNIEEARVIEDLVDLNNIGMLELTRNWTTESRISHSFI